MNFIASLFRPSQGFDSPAYGRAATAVFHAVLGALTAFLAALYGGWIVWAGVGLYIVKEALDVRQSGSQWDSVEDLGAVLLGVMAWHQGVSWPVVLIGVGLVVGIVASIRSK